MNERNVDELEARLARLPREVPPARDLWPGIATAIAEAPAARGRAAPAHSARPDTARRFTAWRIAASVLLIVASSAITYGVMQRSLREEVAQVRREAVREMQPVLSTM